MQWLAALCVRRPIFASVLILVVCVVGIAGYLQLGVDRFPNVDFPIIVVLTNQPGRRARGHRDRDHRQGGAGGQHHQRHRRAAVGDDRGRLAGHHHVRPREERRRGRAGGARPAQHDPPRPAEGHRPARRAEARPGRSRRSSIFALQLARPLAARDDRARRQARAPHSSSRSTASGRFSLSAGSKRQINVWLDPIKLRGAARDRHRRAARDRLAEPDDSGRSGGNRTHGAHAPHPRARDRPGANRRPGRPPRSGALHRA